MTIVLRLLLRKMFTDLYRGVSNPLIIVKKITNEKKKKLF